MKKIKAYFDGYFHSWGIVLPQADLSSLVLDKDHELCKEGWTIRYKFGAQDGKGYMDFYASHRMTNDRHERVWEDGRVEGLPAPLDFVLLPSRPIRRPKAHRDSSGNGHGK